MKHDPLKTLFDKGYSTEAAPDGFVGQVLAAKATQRRRNQGLAAVFVMVCLAFGVSQTMQAPVPTAHTVASDTDAGWILELQATYDAYDTFEHTLYESDLDVDAEAELPDDTYAFLQFMDLDS